MLDEDVVLKFARYTNERVLIINAFLMAILPAIFNGGNSMIAMCLIFSIGLIAPINVISYPRIWVDAQEYVRLKYFVSILPIAALLCLTIFRASTPAISELYIEGEAFDYISNFACIYRFFYSHMRSYYATCTLCGRRLDLLYNAIEIHHSDSNFALLCRGCDSDLLWHTFKLGGLL